MKDGPTCDARETEQARPDATNRAALHLRVRRMLRRLAIIVTCTYLSVCLGVFLFQARLIYFPSRQVDFTPRDVGMDFADLRLQTADGVNVAAWHVPCASSQGTVLFFHGNAGNLGDVLLDVQEWHRLAYAVVAVDYRGFGASEGTPTEAGIYEDAETAWRYVRWELKETPDRVVYHGRSLGGAVAIELALRHPPAALIVESTFTSLPDVGAEHYPLLPVRWLAVHRFDSAHKVERIHCPKLFVHGSEDRLIPASIGRGLFDSASAPKHFILTGGDHGDGGMLYDDATKSEAIRWLIEALKAPRFNGEIGG